MYDECLAIVDAPNTQALRSALVRFTRRTGFDTVSAMAVLDVDDGEYNFHAVDNVPEAYRADGGYEDLTLARRDPVMQHCRRCHFPIAWDRRTYVKAGQDDLWEQQATYGLKTGIAMALHLPKGRHFAIGLDRTDPLPTNPSQVTRMIADVRLFASYAQEAAMKVLLPALPLSEPPELNAKELECLRWTLEGKSAWEVGRILGIAELAVYRHTHHAARKLACASEHQAVAKALRLRLIH